MPLFFIVGGYANGLSWRSARRRGDSYAVWLRSRLQRLAAPVLPLLVVWLAIASIGVCRGRARRDAAHRVAGGPRADLVPRGIHRRRRAGPAPARRLGTSSAGGASAAGLALGGLVDWWSIAGDNHWIGFANYLVVWATVHQLGFAWLDGSLAGPGRRVALAAVGFAGLVDPGLGRALPDLDDRRRRRGAQQLLPDAGHAGVPRACSRPASCCWPSAGWPPCSSGRGCGPLAVVVNLRIMSLYLWHLTAMVLVIGVSLLAGGLGLRAVPSAGTGGRPGRCGSRVLAARDRGAGAGLRAVREADPRPAPRPVAVAAGPRDRGAVRRARGDGRRPASCRGEGVHWVWPLLPVAAVLGLGVVPRPRSQDRHPAGLRSPLLTEWPSAARNGSSGGWSWRPARRIVDRE